MNAPFQNYRAKALSYNKVLMTGQYRVQITKDGEFLGKRTFNLRKDAEAYKKRLKK